MPDPNDYADNEAEGQGTDRGDPKAGLHDNEGVKTEDAGEAYKNDANEHFRDKTDNENDEERPEEKPAITQELAKPE